MLEPLQRRHLLESLRPPEGYDVDAAIGTTYSLDLMTLLTVPLSFALADREDDEGGTKLDPLALLEAIRRYADRIHIFCQAGSIYLPKGHKLFLSHLERAVHEVVAPRQGGVFHPKVWVLRFTPHDPADPVTYRVLVLSRNITFDRSWDTLLVLEGDLRARQHAFRKNSPLGDFIEALPAMMLQQPGKPLRDLVQRIADELRRVSFDLPPGFKDLRFHPLGLANTDAWWFDGRIDRMLTVSPFVDPGMLADLGAKEDGDILVSRLDQLCSLPAEALSCFKDVYFLIPDAEPEGEPDVDHADSEEESTTDEPVAESLAGLHAKLYVADDRWHGRVWTGSANATTAAMRRNVEFMVELVGKKSVCGVDAMLERAKTKADARFADLLSRYVPDESSPPESTGEQELDRLKQNLRIALAKARLHGTVVESDDSQRFDVTLKWGMAPRLPGGDVVDVRIWPVTIHEEQGGPLALGAGSDTSFTGLSFEALTCFYGLEVQGHHAGKTFTDRFVLNIPLAGLPTDRSERVLRVLLHNKQRVLQFLLFLLAEDATMMLGDENRSQGAEDTGGMGILTGDTPLLESLVQALHADVAKIDRVAAVVNDLLKTDEGRQLLPDDFLPIWEPVWAARQEMET